MQDKTISFFYIILFLICIFFLGTASCIRINENIEKRNIQSTKENISHLSLLLTTLGNPPLENKTADTTLGKDSWGNSMKLKFLGDKHFMIISSGPDKKFGNDDDIVGVGDF